MKNLAITLLLVFSFDAYSQGGSPDIENSEEQHYMVIGGSPYKLILFCKDFKRLIKKELIKRELIKEEELILPAKAQMVKEICEDTAMVTILTCGQHWKTKDKNDCLADHGISAVKFIWSFSRYFLNEHDSDIWLF